MSVRAIARRAYDLGLINAAQYRTANVHLVKTGQAKAERHDEIIEPERPELLSSAIQLLQDRDPLALGALLDELGLRPNLIERLLDQMPIRIADGVGT